MGHCTAAEGDCNLAACLLADEDIDGAYYIQDDMESAGSPMAVAIDGRSHRTVGAGMVGGVVSK